MVALRDLMQERYGGWRNDLLEDGGWREFFQNAPAPDAVGIRLRFEVDHNIPIWPGRREADQARHICRPFEHIAPQDVRVIVLGQDPYTDQESATGRSFEDGTQDGADRPIKPSLRVLAQSALDINGGEMPGGLCHRPQLRSALIRGRFDGLVAQGVLFLNAAWTRTNDQHLTAHLNFWRPVVAFTLTALMNRLENPAVILLLGRKAQDSFARMQIPGIPPEQIVAAPHPAERHDEYLAAENPLQRVNEAVEAQGQGNPIIWWP